MADAMETVLDDLKSVSDESCISVGEIVDAFKNRSLGALLTLLAFIAAIPVLGAIPGVSIVTGSLIVVAVVQSLFASGGVWVPEKMRALEIESDKIETGVEKARPVAKRLDKLLKPRLTWLVESRVAFFMIALTVFILGISFIPLALIPWGIQASALAVLCFGLALLGEDGAFAVAGYALTATSAALVLWVF